VIVLLALVAVVSADPFADFIMTHNKAYTAEEFSTRRAIFAENLRVIEETNAMNLSYTLGVNAYTDLSWAEFSAQFLMAPQHCSATVGNYKVKGR